ncbi:sensor histidine kinase [Anaerosporobacter sp.]|uniref:sensor histidine kinase n=1 Tax=Anaerosporobacter sp. TaxID=1872529 RepID=UPI00286ECE8E|nr:GHKL domain-containing protein [Anaerosporobacter sp.]
MMILVLFGRVLLVEILEMMIMIVMLNKLFKIKLIKKPVLYYVISVLFVLVFFFTTLYQNDYVSICVSMLVEFLVVLLIFDEKMHTKILIFICVYIGNGIIIEIGLCIVQIITKYYVYQIYNVYLFKIILYLLIIGMVLLISKFVNVNMRKIKWYYYILIAIAMVCWVIIMEYLFWAQEYNTNKTNSTISVIFGLIGIITTFIIIIILLALDSSHQYHLEQKRWQNKLFEMQNENYKRIFENDVNIRKFKHDLNSHLNCIYQIAEENDYVKVSQYVCDLLKNVSELAKENINSGNKIVDAVINQMYSKIIENNIKINFQGNVPANIKISDIDLCTIFYNALSNAVEACIELKNNRDKEINVFIKSYSNVLFISFENPVDDGFDIKTIDRGSTKNDKRNHGFGIVNLTESVEKYGEISFLCRDNTFFVSIYLFDVL